MKPNFYPFPSKKQILNLVSLDSKFRNQCLLVLFGLQTKVEQDTEDTVHRNHKGFMSSHATHGTRLAKKLLAGETFDAEDDAKVDAIVPRYGKQLAIHWRSEMIRQDPALGKVARLYGC